MVKDARNAESGINSSDTVLNKSFSNIKSKYFNDLGGRLGDRKSRFRRVLEVHTHRFPEIFNSWLMKFSKNLPRTIGIHLNKANRLTRNLQLHLTTIPIQATGIGLRGVEHKQEKRSLVLRHLQGRRQGSRGTCHQEQQRPQ